MEIIHLSSECYPVAKAGGLGDVVGALPKYQVKMGHYAKVVMPMYRKPFLFKHEWVVDFKGHTNIGNYWFDYTVIKEKDSVLGFDLFLIDINGLLDRPEVYGYDDDDYRFTAFSIAFVNWLSHWQHQPDIVHCHDHPVGLVPFMMQHCYQYGYKLGNIPTMLTIHNAEYQGWMGWDQSHWLPDYDKTKGGLLEWDLTVNRLASAVKCAWKVSTVSWNYLHELTYSSNGLEALFEYEKGKCVGILNGIDTEVWSAETDPFIEHHYTVETVNEGKEQNKLSICKEFNLNPEKPLVVFIGRLVGEKAADLLHDAIISSMYTMRGYVNFLILGSGDPQVEWQLSQLIYSFPGNYNAVIGFKEKLSHHMYAAADFLLMPSRIEPCGLNQMYSMKYGTMPIVRNTGGLHDTVTDMGEPGGWGIRFNQAVISDIVHSIGRAVGLFYDNKEQLNNMRKHMMQIDNSWQNTVQQYIDVYQGLQ